MIKYTTKINFNRHTWYKLLLSRFTADNIAYGLFDQLVVKLRQPLAEYSSDQILHQSKIKHTIHVCYTIFILFLAYLCFRLSSFVVTAKTREMAYYMGINTMLIPFIALIVLLMSIYFTLKHMYRKIYIITDQPSAQVQLETAEQAKLKKEHYKIRIFQEVEHYDVLIISKDYYYLYQHIDHDLLLVGIIDRDQLDEHEFQSKHYFKYIGYSVF